MEYAKYHCLMWYTRQRYVSRSWIGLNSVSICERQELFGWQVVLRNTTSRQGQAAFGSRSRRRRNSAKISSGPRRPFYFQQVSSVSNVRQILCFVARVHTTVEPTALAVPVLRVRPQVDVAVALPLYRRRCRIPRSHTSWPCTASCSTSISLWNCAP